eukprot:3552526-Heterocapsa_arctica.AAC.1
MIFIEPTYAMNGDKRTLECGYVAVGTGYAYAQPGAGARVLNTEIGSQRPLMIFIDPTYAMNGDKRTLESGYVDVSKGRAYALRDVSGRVLLNE